MWDLLHVGSGGLKEEGAPSRGKHLRCDYWWLPHADGRQLGWMHTAATWPQSPLYSCVALWLLVCTGQDLILRSPALSHDIVEHILPKAQVTPRTGRLWTLGWVGKAHPPPPRDLAPGCPPYGQCGLRTALHWWLKPGLVTGLPFFLSHHMACIFFFFW